VHAPAATPVTVLPLTVQIVAVVELNVTAKPELAVALSVPVPPTVSVGAVPNVIVCVAAPIGIICVTCAAARLIGIARLAGRNHARAAATPVTVEPEIEQIVGVVLLNVTASPELAVAVTVPVPPTLMAGAVPKVIVWLPGPTVMVCVTCGGRAEVRITRLVWPPPCTRPPPPPSPCCR